MHLGPILYENSASWAVPYCALACMTWPNYGSYRDGKARTHPPTRFRFPERFQNGSIMEIWPLQIEILENLQQSAFWDVQVATLGSNVIKFPRMYGKRSEKGGKIKNMYGEAYDKWIGPNRVPLPEPEAAAEASDLVKWEVEQDRRIRADAIAISQRITRREERSKNKAEKNQRAVMFRADQQALLDSALRQHDVNNCDRSLVIYQDLRTPFATIAVQRNIGAWALKQAGYGPEAGERDRQRAALECIKMEALMRTQQGNAMNNLEFNNLIKYVIDVSVKEKTLPAAAKSGTDDEKLAAVMGVMQAIAQRQLDIAPKSSDLGWVDFTIPLPALPARTAAATARGQGCTRVATNTQLDGSGTPVVAGPSGSQGQGQTKERPADTDDDDDAVVKRIMTASGAAAKPSVGNGGDKMDIDTEDVGVFRWFTRKFNLK
jgi:hypothetical protein